MILVGVEGLPAPQGSKVPYMDRQGRARLREDSPGFASWRLKVAQSARLATGARRPMDGPLILDAIFRFQVPKAQAATLRRHGGVLWKSTTPDCSKLVRAVEDSLKDGGAIHDDARFSRINVAKVWVESGEGVLLRIRQLEGLPTVPVTLRDLAAAGDL